MTAIPVSRRVPFPPELAAWLGQRFGERCTTARAILERHGGGETFHPVFPPDAVVFPDTAEEVALIVRACAERRTPVVPFGVGTSLEGHFAALNSGVCIDLSRMNRILRVGADDLDCTVEAGVTRRQLNEHVRDLGLFFPIDPGADATLGGMAATRASGTNAVRYGTMRENVLALTVVTPEGRLIRTGGRARKSSAGYDLTRLYVGSEGTLGVITDVTLRLYGAPEAISAAVCGFESLEGAVRTVVETIQLGVPVARAELLDALQMRAVNRWSKTDWPEVATLFFEFHGSPAGVEEQATTVQAVAREQGGSGFRWAVLAEDRSRLWKARHEAFYAALALRPGSTAWTTDVCVPISRLAECVTLTQAELARASIPAPIVGHVGDGNFHVIFVVDPANPAEFEEAARLNDALVRRALDMGGTCTGEHGVGWGKMEWLREEAGEGALDMMRRIKAALDPLGIMNPGKVVAAPAERY
jgi:D-lactate dehydrogenase (cytochrome)